MDNDKKNDPIDEVHDTIPGQAVVFVESHGKAHYIGERGNFPCRRDTKVLGVKEDAEISTPTVVRE